MVDATPTPLDLVREMRATGNYGHDVWIQSLDKSFGEAVVASRQLESSVTRIAAAWVDGSMDDDELWDLLDSNLQENVSEFATILRNSFRQSGENSHEQIVELTCTFLTDLRAFHEKTQWDFGQTCIAATIVAMFVRQLLEDTCTGGNGTKELAMSSSNVNGEFLATCLSKLTKPPFSVKPGCDLNEAEQNIALTLVETQRD